MDETTRRLNDLRVAYGAIRAARAALESAHTGMPIARDIADRIETLSEELRQLQRTIASEVGL